MSNWIPLVSIPAKSDGDPLTAKDLKDLVASLQSFLTGVLTSAGGDIVPPSMLPGDIRYADFYAPGSQSGGVQEAINSLSGANGTVWMSGKVYSCSVKVTVPTGVSL